MTPEQEDKLKELLGGRRIDVMDESFIGGGSWEGGEENISFSEIAAAVDYIRNIGIKIKK